MDPLPGHLRTGLAGNREVEPWEVGHERIRCPEGVGWEVGVAHCPNHPHNLLQRKDTIQEINPLQLEPDTYGTDLECPD